MQMPVNTFKQRLAREAQIGVWVGLADPYCAELAANAGFDWLLLDGEHAPNDLRSLLGQLQAVAPYACQAVVRPPVGDPVLIKQLLDIGAQTLLVPMVETAEQARGLVAAMHYPPHGIRGVGAALARASRWNSIPDYLDEADAQMCLLVQVESVRGLENLDAIAAPLPGAGLRLRRRGGRLQPADAFHEGPGRTLQGRRRGERRRRWLLIRTGGAAPRGRALHRLGARREVWSFRTNDAPRQDRSVPVGARQIAPASLQDLARECRFLCPVPGRARPGAIRRGNAAGGGRPLAQKTLDTEATILASQ